MWTLGPAVPGLRWELSPPAAGPDPRGSEYRGSVQPIRWDFRGPPGRLSPCRAQGDGEAG